MGHQGLAALGAVVMAFSLLLVPIAVFDGPEAEDDQPPTGPPGTATTSPPAEKTVTLRPDGVGALRLGMTPREVEATGQATSTQGSAHEGWPPGCQVLFYEDSYATADGPDGRISPEQGLEQIAATLDMQTPEGIGVGSTRDELVAAYPDVTIRDNVNVVTIPVSERAVYHVIIGIESTDKIDTLTLELNDQDCGR